MKKSTDKVTTTRTLERDLKTFFQNETVRRIDFRENPQPPIDLEGAIKLFDELRARRGSTQPGDTGWSHPSVLALRAPDPVSTIIERARGMVLEAMEKGWAGPPYNPFALAEMFGRKLLPTEEVLDARTRADSSGRFTIEFNPQRPPARMRYSIAHELGHTLFPDCAEAVRNRATHQEMKADDWQLEALCNIAAAEILMPFGTLKDEVTIRPSGGLILDLRRRYLVSSEAVVNRLIRLTSYPCLAFFARRESDTSSYFIEYRISSPALQDGLRIHRGYVLPRSSKATECTAIGSRQQEDVNWISGGKIWFVEYLGISPNPGEGVPRVLALAFPPLPADFSSKEPLSFIRGDASEPFGAEQKFLLQVVNDQAQIWGGGFAKHIRKKWPHAQAEFRVWAYGRQNLKLGNIHVARIRSDLSLVSLVAQHGFGKPISGPRVRYGKLFSALEKVADLAVEEHASVHMPRIGTGEAGGNWDIVEGIIRETLIARGVKVTVYDLRPSSHNFPRQSSFEFPRNIVDEVF